MKGSVLGWGVIAICLLSLQTASAQVRPIGSVAPTLRARPASYCSSCVGAPPVYDGQLGVDCCDSCGVPACDPCGCGSVLGEVICGVKGVVTCGVSSIARCLFPAGLCCVPTNPCDPCAGGAWGGPDYVAPGCAGCGAPMPEMMGPSMMGPALPLQPTPAPPQGNPFQDDPSSAESDATQARRPYYSPYAPGYGYGAAMGSRMAGPNRPATLDRSVGYRQTDPYRPRHVSQLRRTSSYSQPARTGTPSGILQR